MKILQSFIVILLSTSIISCGGSSSINDLLPANDDISAPVIELNGDNPMSLFTGETYQEPSAQGTDDVDGSVGVSISGNVDTSVAGVYIITYSASDAANNSTSVTANDQR